MSETTTPEPTEPTPPPADGPLLDLTDAGVKKFIKQAKARGYVTMDELNKVLPSEEVTSEAIEDTLAMLSEMGVNVVEAEEDAPEQEGDRRRGARGDRRRRDHQGKRLRPHRRPGADVPARDGRVELLSREGEIAIAKRIEAGRDTMIRGLCESALTFEAIMVWREELGRRPHPAARGDRPRADLRRPGRPGAQRRGGGRRADRGRAGRPRRGRRGRCGAHRPASPTTTISTTAPAPPSARWRPSCAKASWPPSTPSPASSRPSAACRRSWSSTACAART